MYNRPLNRFEQSVKPFLVSWCVCLIFLELYGAFFLRLSVDSISDFQSFYAAEYLSRTDPHHLYDIARQAQLQLDLASKGICLPFYHPSYEPFLLSPLSILSYRSSYFAFIAFNMLLLLAAFFAARPTFSAVIPWLQPRPGLMFFTSVPLLFAVILGQDSVLSLLLYCLTWRQLEAEKDGSAGFFLALALFKFQIVLPIAALIAIRKGWRFARGFLLTAVGLILLSVFIVGAAGARDYIRVLHDAGTAAGKTTLAQVQAGVYPQSMPNFVGLLYGVGARLLHSPLAFNVLCAIASLAMFVWCARIVRHVELKVAFSIAIFCGLLVSYHLFNYDLTLALLPIALVADRMNRYVVLSFAVLPLILSSDLRFILAIPILLMLVPLLFTDSRTASPRPAILIGA